MAWHKPSGANACKGIRSLRDVQHSPSGRREGPNSHLVWPDTHFFADLTRCGAQLIIGATSNANKRDHMFMMTNIQMHTHTRTVTPCANMMRLPRTLNAGSSMHTDEI